MSAVKISKRSKSNEEAVVAARALAIYTITICSNEKNFPKRHRWSITNKIVETVIEIIQEVYQARALGSSKSNKNRFKDYGIFLLQERKEKDELKIRQQLQQEHIEEAKALLFSFIGLVDISYEIFDIEEKRIKYWMSLVDKVKKGLDYWDINEIYEDDMINSKIG